MIELVTWTSLQLKPARLKKEKRLKVHLCRHSSFKLCASQKVTFPGIDSVVFQIIQIVFDYTWLAFVTPCNVIYLTQSDTVHSFGYIRKVRWDDECLFNLTAPYLRERSILRISSCSFCCYHNLCNKKCISVSLADLWTSVEAALSLVCPDKRFYCLLHALKTSHVLHKIINKQL